MTLALRVDELIAAIAVKSGAGVPNVYEGGTGSVAGDLLGTARSLQHSLGTSDEPVTDGTASVSRRMAAFDEA